MAYSSYDGGMSTSFSQSSPFPPPPSYRAPTPPVDGEESVFHPEPSAPEAEPQLPIRSLNSNFLDTLEGTVMIAILVLGILGVTGVLRGHTLGWSVIGCGAGSIGISAIKASLGPPGLEKT